MARKTSYTTGYYGTNQETYVVSGSGRIWCVQSPDLHARGGEPCEVENLPVGARRLHSSLCVDLIVPDECWK